MSAILCDFCSTPTPEPRRYRAVSFVVHGPYDAILGESVGDWAACSTCAAMIDAGDWRGLARHSADTAETRIGFPLPELMRAEFERELRSLHQQFHKARL